MKRNNVAFCLFISFLILSLIAIFVEISAQMLIAISVSSTIYTFAQTLKNRIDLEDDETRTQLETFNAVGNFNMTAENLFFMKRYAPQFCASKQTKILNKVILILECVAFSALIIGLIIPIPFLENERISEVATILSFAFLFLSIWQVEKYAERKSQWEEIQLICLASKNLPQVPIDHDTSQIDT